MRKIVACNKKYVLIIIKLTQKKHTSEYEWEYNRVQRTVSALLNCNEKKLVKTVLL